MLKKAICFFLLNCIFLNAHGMTKYHNEGSRQTHHNNPNDCNCGPFEVVLCKPNDSGFYPFPYDCNKYIKCEGGQTFIHDCSRGSSFSTELKQCNNDHHTNCRLQTNNVRRYSQNVEPSFVIATENTAHSTDLYQELSQENGTEVYGNEAICNENSPRIQQHPRACWKFIRCEHGKTYIYNCPAGEGFNTAHNICIEDRTCTFLARENAENYNTYASGVKINLGGQSQTNQNGHNQYNPNYPGYDGSGRDPKNPSQPPVHSSTVNDYQGARFDRVDTSSTDEGRTVQLGSDSQVKISSQRPYISPTDENSSSRPGTISSGSATLGGHTIEYGHEHISYNRSYESSSQSTRTNNTQISYADVVSGSSSATGRSETGIKGSRSGSRTRSESATGTIHTSSNTLYEDLQLENELGSIHMGSVQIKINGKWYYICDDKFNIKAANVFCREIGFPEGARQILTNSYFVTAEILSRKKIEFSNFNEVVCHGEEYSLKNCEFIGWGTSSCKADEVVGVICKLPRKHTCRMNEYFCAMQDQCIPNRKVCDGTADCSDLSDEALPQCNKTIEYRLIDGKSDNEGRLQMKYQGKWGTVCDEYFTDLEAKVFCRSKGYYGHATFSRDESGHGYGPIWLTRHSCTNTGVNTNLASCNTGTFAPTNCDHSQDIKIKCIGEGSWAV